jgi:hypothetical protein
MGKIARDANGRFKKGTRSPNPLGRPPTANDQRRLFTSDQVNADFLSLGEEPMTVVVNGQKRTMPTSEVVNRRLIEKATAGDIRAILKVVDLRERYSSARTAAIEGLFETALKIIKEHEYGVRAVPESELRLAHEIRRIALEGQFRASTPPLNSVALLTDEELKGKLRTVSAASEESPETNAESPLNPLRAPSGQPPENES